MIQAAVKMNLRLLPIAEPTDMVSFAEYPHGSDARCLNACQPTGDFVRMSGCA